MVKGKETVLAKSCKDVASRVNWDGVHFTETANRWIFQQINSGVFSDPSIPLKFACTRQIDINHIAKVPFENGDK